MFVFNKVHFTRDGTSTAGANKALIFVIVDCSTRCHIVEEYAAYFYGFMLENTEVFERKKIQFVEKEAQLLSIVAAERSWTSSFFLELWTRLQNPNKNSDGICFLIDAKLLTM